MWFGQEASLLAYVAATSRLPTWIAIEHDEIKGFLTLQQHSPQSFEIHCIAIHAGARTCGIGRTLLAHCESWIAAAGGNFLQVKTIATTAPSPEYQQTRAFYERMGFVALEVFPTLWSPKHPCLQLIKYLSAA